MFTQASITTTNGCTWTNRTSSDSLIDRKFLILMGLTVQKKSALTNLLGGTLRITTLIMYLVKETELRTGAILGKEGKCSKFKLKSVEHPAFLQWIRIFEPVILESVAFKINFPSSRLQFLKYPMYHYSMSTHYFNLYNENYLRNI